ncbi:MAG: hypothetical protein RRY20_00040 [Bilophila sp.]
MVHALLPLVLGSFLLVSGMAQAAPSVTDDLQNTPQPAAPSEQPNTVVTPSTIVTPGTVVVPGGAPNRVQMAPESNTTIVLPDVQVQQDNTVPASPTTTPPVITPQVVVPTTNATQPAPALPQNVVVPVVPEVKTNEPIVVAPAKIPEPPKVEVQKAVPPVIATTPTPPPALLTPADFLVKTPEAAKVAEKKPVQPPKEPKSKEPKKPVPPAKTPVKAEPQKEPAPTKETPKQVAKAAKNAPLMIPEDAKKTGKLDFLEGCWRGTRPEYNTKRIISERFCFDEKGVGKRTIKDPEGGRVCVGATAADMRKDGSLHITSDQAPCLTGEEWGSAEMVCIGEGNSTPCAWEFPDINGARQSYKIRFVRD